MAGSRLEKVGTIYTRASGLIKSGALNWEDRPIWYDIYEAFPPKEEPKFDRPVPNVHLKKIFYEEDKIRAIFHRNNKNVGITNFFNKKHTTLTQKFIECYQKLDAQYEGSATEEQLYKESIDMLRKDKESKTITEEDAVSLSNTFREAQKANKTDEPKLSQKINISELFKE